MKQLGWALLVAAVCVLQAAAAAGVQAQQPAAEPSSKLTTSRAFLGLNHTCFKLCQLGSLPASPPAEVFRVPTDVTKRQPAQPNPSSSPQLNLSPSSSSVDTELQQDHSSSSTSSTPAGGPDASAADPSTPTVSVEATTRHLLATNGTTSTTTPNTSTAPPAMSCAQAVDQQAAALLARRYRGFKISLGMSDFFELFYSIGNLWYAIDDLLKQGLTAMSTGHFQVNAEQILLFNANMAGITAWFSNLVQNILLLAGDQLLPLPTDELTAPQ